MRLCERDRAALADRLDRPDRHADPEQVTGELGHVTARDAVARGQRQHRCLQPGPERRGGDVGREPRGRPAFAARAAQTMAAMLPNNQRDRRQLDDLTPTRTPRRQLLLIAELVPATAAAVGVVIDELVDLILAGERPAGALMPGLPTRSAPLPIPRQQLLRLRPRLRPPLLTRLRRILRRRPRPGTRTLPRPLLKPPDALLQQQRLRGQPLHRRGQLKDDLDATLPARVIDRLRLRPLHTTQFDDGTRSLHQNQADPIRRRLVRPPATSRATSNRPADRAALAALEAALVEARVRLRPKGAGAAVARSSLRRQEPAFAIRHSTLWPRTAAYRSRVESFASTSPLSRRATADCEVPITAATAVWVRPSSSRREPSALRSSRRRTV